MKYVVTLKFCARERREHETYRWKCTVFFFARSSSEWPAVTLTKQLKLDMKGRRAMAVHYFFFLSQRSSKKKNNNILQRTWNYGRMMWSLYEFWAFGKSYRETKISIFLARLSELQGSFRSLTHSDYVVFGENLSVRTTLRSQNIYIPSLYFPSMLQPYQFIFRSICVHKVQNTNRPHTQ